MRMPKKTARRFLITFALDDLHHQLEELSSRPKTTAYSRI